MAFRFGGIIQINEITRDVPLLSTPINLRSVEVRTGIDYFPNCRYVSDDGEQTEWHMVDFGCFAMDSCGIVFGEETAVEAHGCKKHYCAGLYKDCHIAQYRRTNVFWMR